MKINCEKMNKSDGRKKWKQQKVAPKQYRKGIKAQIFDILRKSWILKIYKKFLSDKRDRSDTDVIAVNNAYIEELRESH